jgi:resuscitation-promoting factor RpfB
MKKWIGISLSGLMFLSGIGLLIYILLQPVRIMDGKDVNSIRTWQLTTRSVLQDAGIRIRAGDTISPGLSDFFWRNRPIVIKRQIAYLVSVDGKTVQTYSEQEIIGNVLASLGIRLFPGDELIVDSLTSSPDFDIQSGLNHTIQLRRAIPVVFAGSKTYTARSTAGEMFWQTGLPSLGYRLAGISDYASIRKDQQIQLAAPIRINYPGGNQTSSGTSIGSAIAGIGLAPQGLDNTTDNLSGSAGIAAVDYSVNRIEEKLEIHPTSLPYDFQTRLSDDVELDKSQVIQAGAYGLSMQLARIRYENGKEISNKVETETILQPPQDEITGYGTKVTVQTTNVDGQTIQYYRALSLYATSYSPCNLDGITCNSTTASGEKVRKGIVAVILRWYAYMSGQQVYIPGYGYAVIEDTGGGIPGTNWIDLGYSDADFIPWHSWVTVYFLAPVPGNILYDLN